MTPSTALPNLPVRRLWSASPVLTVTIWRATCHGHPGWSTPSSSRWHAADDAKCLEESTKKPVKDGRLGPVPPEARDNEMTLLHNIRWWFYPCKRGSLPPFRYDGAIDAWRKTVLAFSNDRIYIMQRDDPMSTPIPRLTDYEDVEVMIVARHLRGEEGMGAAAVGKGHRNTTYTGYRGPEAPKGKGRRRERDRERAQLFLARERERDPAFRPVYTESASAPGVEEPEVRDPASLMGVKSTNSPDRVEVTQTPPRSRRRDRRVYLFPYHQ